MRFSKTLAVTAAGFALAGSAVLPATASVTHNVHSIGSVKTKQFPTTLTPNKHIKPGTAMTLKGKHAKKKTEYTCVMALVKGTANSPFLGNISSAKSSRKGKVTCHLTFKAFSGTIAGKTVSCPASKANRKAGYECGFAVSTTDMKSAGFSTFT